MSRALFFAGFIGFVSGIFSRSFFFYGWEVLVLLLLIAAQLLLFYVLRGRRLYLAAVVGLLAMVLGGARTMVAPTILPEAFERDVGKEILLEGRVVAEPDLRETSQRIQMLVESSTERTEVLAVLPTYPQVQFGEHITVQGKLARPEPFETGGDRVFRYDQYLAADGVFAIVERAVLIESRTATASIDLVMQALLSIKYKFQAGLTAALSEPGASLASGLITGGKQGLGTDVLNSFIVAGLVHIVVLSGYNVMIVAEAVLRMFSFLSRRRAILLGGLTIGLFVLAAGAGPASIRAGLMAVLALVARATGRTYDVLRALMVVAFAMLLVNPFLLVYDPGFQLSFTATVGLICGAPLISARLLFVKNPFWRELLSSTIAAQVAVLPLLLYQTGLLSLVALPANLLVLPIVPMAMGLSVVAGITGALLPAVAPIVALPAHVFLSYILEVASMLSALPLAAITLPRFSFSLVVGAYLVLGYWVVKASPAPRGAGDALVL